jgi:hypothetical protein
VQGMARFDCVRDTDVAYGHARRHRPSDIDPPFAKNLTLRCEAHTGDARRACLARMDGQGTTSGSVAEGVIYRELVIVETTEAAPAMPATPAAANTLSAPMAPMLPLAPAAPTGTPPSATNPPTPK